MARKSQKCPPIVEHNQFGCVWNFGGMFDHHHHHGRHHRQLLSDERHVTKTLPGAGHTRSQVRMLTFDEHLRNINIESKKKTAIVIQSLKGETSSSNSNHTRKNNDEVLKNNNIEKSFWKKIKSKYENPKKKSENEDLVDTIVVLKPTQRLLECWVDLGCHCSDLQPHQISTRKQQLVKHKHVSFNDVRKQLKNAKKMKGSRKIRSCGELNGNVLKAEKLTLRPLSKQREPDVFMEAKRHLADRLKQVAGEASGCSSKQASRTLEKILLSSPVHKSMVRKPKGTHCEKSLLTRVDGCIEGSQPELSLDVSSPKADCKLENMDNDQFRENPSPVSVLESFFTDNISSPTSTIESVELQIQANRLDFEEHSSQTSSPPHQKTSLNSFMEDQGFITSYVNTIYQVSESNWEDFLATDYPNPLESSCDHKLVHDCVKELLVSLRSRVTFVSSKIRPFSFEKDVVNEVIERVDWHNGQPMGGPRTLDHIVRKDIGKCGQWVDVISDGNDIVFEVLDDTLQELIMEAVCDIQF